MGREQHSLPKKRLNPLPSIEAMPRSIEQCEQRLALSASLAGDLLLELLDVDSIQDDLDATGPDLIQQSAELRAEQGLDGSGQTVAVIDSGVAWDHVALGGGYGPGYRVVGGWDFAEQDSNPYDDGPAGYHGTHVTGLLAGSTDGFSGIAPGADIVALRVFDDQGAGQLDWIESSLQWVIENQNTFDSPITTVNLSVGAALSDADRDDAMSMLEDELSLLRDHDILVFAATGNFYDVDSEQNDSILYPASSPSVVPVASLGSSGQLSEFAQRESGVLATHGEVIVSAVPDHVFGWDGNVDDFAQLSGTSMATPQVAAASMLIRQSMVEQGVEPTADAILERIQEASLSGQDADSGDVYHTIDLLTAIGDAPASQEFPGQEFQGTTGSERVELDLRNGIEIRVGGEVVSLLPGDDQSPLRIDVGEGDDSLHIIGSERAERLIANPPTQGESSLSTNLFSIELVGFENISFEGGGGPDLATLFDSPNSDDLKSHPTQTTLSGTGFQFDVTGVPRVYVHGTSGGSDIAFLHDSASDDTLEVRTDFTSLSNENSFQLAYGFERVYAYATAGGFDSASLYDSAGDDTMSISSGRSIIAGVGYQVSARGFESTIGNATAGGNDVAKIYSDQVDSRWHSTGDMVQWTGQDNAVRVARGFEQTNAFEDFEAIELTPQSLNSRASQFWRDFWTDDAKTRAEMEADAARQVFDELGRA